jgi:hypothetical protein
VCINNIFKAAQIYFFASQFCKIGIKVVPNHNLPRVVKRLDNRTFSPAILPEQKGHGFEVNLYLIPNAFEVPNGNAFYAHLWPSVSVIKHL